MTMLSWIAGYFSERSEFFTSIDFLSSMLFVVILGLVLLFNRKRLQLQKIVFPLLYLVLYRTKVGIPLMEKYAEKYRELIKLFGYIAIGIGFAGMVFISANILVLIFKLVLQPTVSQPGVSLVLPFTNVPGIGYLSFWHWIISIFILAIIHEFAHGIVAKAHGLEVKSSGFAVLGIGLPVIPAAFVEPDEKQMIKKPDYVQYSIFAAGPVINILFAILIVVIFPFTATGGLAPFEDRLTEPNGFSFDLVNESYPASLAGMQDGMIITSINDVDVDDYSDFITEMMCVAPGDEVILGTPDETFPLVAGISPDDAKKGFVGIRPIQNERIVKEGYESEAKVFFWFKGLIKWLFLLNLFIGLANLLPLGIVDGGRMLQVALDKIITNKEKSKRIWGFVGLLFIVFLLFALAVTYLGNPFSFLG